MLFRNTEKKPDKFWDEFEAETGEKVLAKSLGRYLSGWDDFDSRGWEGIWGLFIACSGGFRFHHFPQRHWLEAFTRFTDNETPKEKSFFLPKEKIITVEHIEETQWWKKLLRPVSPRILIQYRDERGTGRRLLLESDFNSAELAEKLNTFT